MAPQNFYAQKRLATDITLLVHGGKNIEFWCLFVAKSIQKIIFKFKEERLNSGKIYIFILLEYVLFLMNTIFLQNKSYQMYRGIFFGK